MSQHRLFAYGTLQVPEIVRQILGRLPTCRPALLHDYTCQRLRHRVYPAAVAQAGGRVTGQVYSGIEAHEIKRLDVYEGELYERRVLVLSVDGVQVEAEAYLLRDAYQPELSGELWDLEVFRREHFASYLEEVTRTSRAP